MKKISFYKLQASGNDFILIDSLTFHIQRSVQFYKKFAKKYCMRKLGIGADGLLIIEPSKKSLFKMRIFNPDGSEAEMCGNGARCAALWAAHQSPATSRQFKFETKAGILEAAIMRQIQATGSKPEFIDVRIKTTEPFDLKLNVPLTILGQKIKVNYINTGVPQVVVFVEGLEKIDVEKIGREIRFHKKFSPAGTNVNFLESSESDSLKIRTYERGVEAETLACGTGAIASAIIADIKEIISQPRRRQAKSQTDPRRGVEVLTKSGEISKVYFNREETKVSDVWLEGKAYLVYEGKIDI